MIYTVFCSTSNAELQSNSELLAYSWGRAQQSGELVHLSPSKRDGAPCHRLAREITTQTWSPHPYTGDLYPPYNRAAALLEWLFVERVDGTILLLEPSHAFRASVTSEVAPAHAKGTDWPNIPRGSGPFGLGPDFEFLTRFCVDRDLDLSPVRLPVLIHSNDLRKLAARWLELMSIIRAETAGAATGAHPNADAIAYVIAAAEANVPHAIADLNIDMDAPEALRAEYFARRADGAELAFMKPRRHKGVREGKILGSVFLEIPGRADTVSLNSSAAAIWEVCDGTRSLAEINRELETRFSMPPGSLRADIEVVIQRLERIGSLRLEQA